MARRSEIDQLAINTIRMLAVDAVQKANSGHPGTPMDAAPIAYVLWQRFLRYDPADPHWLNSVSPGTGANLPLFQSSFACSIRSIREDTKFHQM
jgi:Transketolase, thiamine diphosphate binding domain